MRRKALSVLNSAWLFASDDVLNAIHAYLDRYDQLRKEIGQDSEKTPRGDWEVEERIDKIYKKMREDPDLVGDIDAVSQNQIKFYEWTR